MHEISAGCEPRQEQQQAGNLGEAHGGPADLEHVEE